MMKVNKFIYLQLLIRRIKLDILTLGFKSKSKYCLGVIQLSASLIKRFLFNKVFEKW